MIEHETCEPTEEFGTVVEIGPGRVTPEGNTVPMRSKVGDRVLFFKNAGTEVKINGEKLILVSEVDVYGRFEPAVEA